MTDDTDTDFSSRHETAAPAPTASTRAPQPPRPAPDLLHPPPAAPPAHRHDARQPLHVEIVTASTSSRGRPAGHVWLIRLRRGPHQVTLAVGLGRPSADHLARQIRDVINPPPLASPTQTR